MFHEYNKVKVMKDHTMRMAPSLSTAFRPDSMVF